jgi:RHS repeat-associated protein
VIERMAYEPFGKRRFTNGQYDQAGTIDAQSTNRGFTGHEHLDSLDFIHMNARVYDPDIGRFLSPDPTVPGAHNPQAFNRYAYAFNSPLNLVDPDGFEPRAADGSFADGGHRGVNSGPRASNGGPATGANGTAAAGNATGTNQPQNKQDAAPIPGVVAEPIEKPAKQPGLWEQFLDWVTSCDSCNKAIQGMPMIGSLKAIGPAVKALDKVDDVAKAVAAAKAAATAATQISTQPRALTALDLGLKGKVSELTGTISLVDGKLTVNIDMIAGRFTNKPQDVTNALNNLAVSLGAKSVEINATIANSAIGRALQMDGWAATRAQVSPYADTFSRTVK